MTALDLAYLRHPHSFIILHLKLYFLFEFDLNSWTASDHISLYRLFTEGKQPQLWILNLKENYLNGFLQENPQEDTFWCGKFSDILLSIKKISQKMVGWGFVGVFSGFFFPYTQKFKLFLSHPFHTQPQSILSPSISLHCCMSITFSITHSSDVPMQIWRCILHSNWQAALVHCFPLLF